MVSFQVGTYYRIVRCFKGKCGLYEIYDDCNEYLGDMLSEWLPTAEDEKNNTEVWQNFVKDFEKNIRAK